jgi:hypothetical protein
MEIEISMEINRRFTSENAFYLTYVDTGEVILNSTRDFEALGPPFQTEVLSDFCAPVGQYSFVLVDAARDGFLDGGFLEVSVNGELVGSVSGNFGESATIDFGSSAGGPGPVGFPSSITNSPVEANAPVSSPADGDTFVPTPVGNPSFVSKAAYRGWAAALGVALAGTGWTVDL